MSKDRIPDASEVAKQLIIAAYKDARKNGRGIVGGMEDASEFANWVEKRQQVTVDGKSYFPQSDEAADKPTGS